MFKVENCEVFNIHNAVRAMRHPLESYAKSDSDFSFPQMNPIIGDNDMKLMHRLFSAGSEHRKFMRQIFVTMDITAPLYWWKEFDTYKVGTTANSCSTMHTLHKRDLTLDDFSIESLDRFELRIFEAVINRINGLREDFLETKDKKTWLKMIQLLPSSYNQKRTVTMNYENAVNMIHQREGHKLQEWNTFVSYLRDLPYLEEIMYGRGEEETK